MKKIRLPLAIGSILVVLALGLAAYYFFAQGSNSNNDTTSKTCTTYDGRVEEQCIEDYIGLSQEVAVAKAKAHGYLPTIVKVDGEKRAATDIFGYKIYLEIEDGIVVRAYFEDGRPRT